MDNSEQQTINDAVTAVIASQIFIKSACIPSDPLPFDRLANHSLIAAKAFVEQLGRQGYDPATLITKGAGL